MSILDDIKNSEMWKSTESRAAIFVTGVLVVIAGFLVYNYYQKTDTLQTANDKVLDELQDEIADNNDQTETADENDGETLGTDTERTDSYIVKEGDTLWSVAEEQLGDPYRWTDIKDLNQLESTELSAGQLLTLPTDETEVAAADTTEETATEDTTDNTATEDTTGDVLSSTDELAETYIGTTTYTVQAGDTIWSIAEQMYGDPYQYVKILDANPNLGRLPSGQVLIHSGNVLTIPSLQ